jgi:predicted RNA-binding protein associated with RNAse of E/G family
MAIHTPTLSYHYLDSKRRKMVSSHKHVVYDVTDYQVINGHLHFKIEQDSGEWRVLEGYVIPELSLQIVRFSWQDEVNPPHSYNYYIDAIRVLSTGSCWQVRDLYLDILVYDRQRAEVKDTGEFLAAQRAGHLGPDEIDHTLNTTHATLNGLAKHDYSLPDYLESHGFALPWTK